MSFTGGCTHLKEFNKGQQSLLNETFVAVPRRIKLSNRKKVKKGKKEVK
jgi:hypothetical protein